MKLSGIVSIGLSLRDLSDLVPKGRKDSAWGFNPRLSVPKVAPPERVVESGFTDRAIKQSLGTHHLPPLQGWSKIWSYPGLKPRAESCHPFGISLTVPSGTKRRPLITVFDSLLDYRP